MRGLTEAFEAPDRLSVRLQGQPSVQQVELQRELQDLRRGRAGVVRGLAAPPPVLPPDASPNPGY
ncbi:hypothetical protein FKG94_19895 [Exilibacterium tricleocarpae]|uniref:Uncharacterized protein n=1 Tax=Exilibacterium tricleocarpae TaxID=2591008 RepID=A0A545T1S4_9GAMM|nr:hypothetical protein [Exilibacterium tricleocarpae]TQV71152.1 hypothetical protein FKG94_19895 [Exilibacterium tricleocarpae]